MADIAEMACCGGLYGVHRATCFSVNVMGVAMAPKPEAIPLDLSLVEEGFTKVLRGLGLSTEDPHFKDTSRRAAKAWYYELCAGLTKEPPTITVFPSKSEEMILLKDIPIHSMCAHHLLPFSGKACIAYVPGKGEIMGLSKLSRIANYFARRPQVQEELTAQIANYIAELVIGPPVDEKIELGGGDFMIGKRYRGGVAVLIRAKHLCMELRGVNHPGEMVTSALRGVFLDKPEARAEFLSLAGK